MRVSHQAHPQLVGDRLSTPFNHLNFSTTLVYKGLQQVPLRHCHCVRALACNCTETDAQEELHYHVWRQVAGGSSGALVFGEQVQLEGGFDDKLEQLERQLPGAWDIAYLSLAGTQSLTKVSSECNLQAYLISPNGAKKLLRHLEKDNSQLRLEDRVKALQRGSLSAYKANVALVASHAIAGVAGWLPCSVFTCSLFRHRAA